MERLDALEKIRNISTPRKNCPEGAYHRDGKYSLQMCFISTDVGRTVDEVVKQVENVRKPTNLSHSGEEWGPRRYLCQSQAGTTTDRWLSPTCRDLRAGAHGNPNGLSIPSHCQCLSGKGKIPDQSTRLTSQKPWTAREFSCSEGGYQHPKMPTLRDPER